ncbi:hypothetical protein HZA75_01460 [Candidatus Roizmanbacteria bacterium]|nr:hypothetical protein [Candidatus Roizmanbacteria bacterium]
MIKKKKPEQILKNYEEKSEAILQKMMQVLMRAQRKVDDKAYRNILEKIQS